MPHICIWSSGYKFAFRAVNQLPPFPHYHKPDQDKPVTDEMDDRHHLPTASEECEPEMSACMGERVQYRISAAEYSCEDVIVSGKPYISVNSATKKARVTPMDLHSL